MIKIFTSLWFQFFVVPSLIFIVLVLNYGNYSKMLPVSFYDEVLWVGRSYFFEIYINGDYKNRVWKSVESYEEPKLAQYAYAAWLYPQYFKERQNNDKAFDYTQYLILNGFYQINESYLDAYADFERNHEVIEFDVEDNGFPDEYVTKYGINILKPINLIYRARELNTFLLAGAVVFAYFFVLQNIKVIGAVIFSLYYGFNDLIIDMGLKAHSEALFLFTFNAAFLFMNLYFVKGRKVYYLLLFSIFAGLCMSTKLNGTMLLVIFFMANTFMFFSSRVKKDNLFVNILPVLVSLVIFVSLHPLTYSDPVKEVSAMFAWRMKTAQRHALIYKEASLPDRISRFKSIFNNFFFSEQVPAYNSTKIYEQLSTMKNYGNILFALFIIGLFYSVKNFIAKKVPVIVTVCSFITIVVLMSFYLTVSWHRYYIQLSLFFSIFQSLGLYFVIKYFYKFAKLLTLRIKKSRTVNVFLQLLIRHLMLKDFRM